MICPTPSCGGPLVDRVHGAWCPRCRGWVVLSPETHWEPDEGGVGRRRVETYSWTVATPRGL